MSMETSAIIVSPDTAHAELHARPFPIVNRPALLWHASQYHEDPTTFAEQEAALLQSFPFQSIKRSGDDVETFHCDHGELRIEQHQEFTSYTWLQSHPNPTTVFPNIDQALKAWFDQLPGTPLSRLRLAVLQVDATTPDRNELVPLLGDYQICGAYCSDRAAVVWTTFQHDDDGWIRFLIHDLELNSDRRCGRLCQHVIESEDYRVLSLMSLPHSKKLQKRLNQMENRLTQSIELLNQQHGQPDDNSSDRSILHALNSLAIDVEHQRASFSKRASATDAYARIMHDRLDHLNQDRIPRFQSLSEFLLRRVHPPLHSIRHNARRLDHLSLRLDRACDLLRTRVNITLEEQNTQLLHSLDQRAQAQLHLQETVEGLSVVAISYYTLGLCAYFTGGLKELGLPVNKNLSLLLLLPLVIGFAWYSIHTIRNSFKS